MVFEGRDNLSYEKYIEELEESSDGMNVRKSIQSKSEKRTGFLGKIRDFGVFIREFWKYGRQWLGPFKELVYMLALIPSAIVSANAFFNYAFGIRPFPVARTSIYAIVIFFSVLLMGYLGYKFGGTKKRSIEMADKQDPVFYMLWSEQKEIKQRLEELEEK